VRDCADFLAGHDVCSSCSLEAPTPTVGVVRGTSTAGPSHSRLIQLAGPEHQSGSGLELLRKHLQTFGSSRRQLLAKAGNLAFASSRVAAVPLVTPGVASQIDVIDHTHRNFGGLTTAPTITNSATASLAGSCASYSAGTLSRPTRAGSRTRSALGRGNRRRLGRG
jgi:hypothetical protein